MFNTFTTSCVGVFFIFCTQCCCGNYPLLDVDTNMRIVLIPHDIPIGSIIYRLRASDSDNNFPLRFEVLGGVGELLLDLEFLGCSVAESLCQADVILKKRLDIGRTYEYQISVTDTTGDFTRVKAAITSTHGTVFVETMLGSKILRIPENTAIGTELENFVVAKNELNTRPVLLELREPSGRIDLKQKLLSNNRTEGVLYLKKEVDFEKEPWFTFKLLALNGHTNSTVDTRNIIVSEVAVLVADVQDMPPRFTSSVFSVELSNKLRPGDLITRVEAEDGDKENKRLIRYGLLSDSNPFVTFFDLDPMTGEIRLKRNISELFLMAKPNEPIHVPVIAEEIVSDNMKFARLSDYQTSTVVNLTFWFGQDISIGPPMFSFDKYYGEIKENSLIGTPVSFSLETKVWVGHVDASIELDFFHSRENNGFVVSPKIGRGNITFTILVSDSTLLDYERIQLVRLNLRAWTSSGLTSTVPLEISILDVNDNAPIFTQKEYHVEINEMAPYGTKVLQINATDKDSGLLGHVIYSGLVGSDAFRIDSETGMITVEKPLELDRESQSEIRLYVEAKDGGLTESNDPGFIRNVATATVIVKLRDVNEPPICESKFYQAILTPELNALKWPVYVKAIDMDSIGPNSEVRYQIIGENRFSIDTASGQIHVKFPIRFSPKDLSESAYLGSFKVHAFDLGNPQMSAECTVQIYSEDVVSQEIGFVFPSSVDQINKDRDRIEKMLSQFTGGHASIITVSPFDSSKSHSPSPQFIEKRLLGPESRNAALNDEHSQQPSAASNKDQSVVLVSVQSPLAMRTRYVDLGSLKDFMLSDQSVATVAPSTQPEVTLSESRTLFWLLIALIILLLLLFILFICCLFCPCCLLFRHGRKSEKIEKHTREEFIDTRPAPRRSRKTYPAQVETMDEVDYNTNYRTREAWSGDNRQWRGSTQPRRGGGRRSRNPQNEHPAPRADEDDVLVEDWEFNENTLPTQYQHGESRMEDLGQRWQMMQQQQPQQRQFQPEQQRRRVAYAGHPHPGDPDFVRHHMDGEQYDRASGPINYGYRSGEGDPPGERKLARQRSPTRSLPPASSDYRIDSTKEVPTRFYKTTDGEVLQLDYDGDEGKEMLLRRFINEQHSQAERSPPQLEEGQFRRRQLTPAGRLSQKRNVGGIVEGYETEGYQLEQESYERPKAASILRRQNLSNESQGVGGREIDKIVEEDEQIPIPGAVMRKKGEKAQEQEPIKLHTSKSHHHHHRHRDKEKDKHDKSKAKRRSRSRSRESSRSAKSKSKSRSKSPLPEHQRHDKTEPKTQLESKSSRSHSRSRSPTISVAKLKSDKSDVKKSHGLLPEGSTGRRESQHSEPITIQVVSPSTAKSSAKDERTTNQLNIGTTTEHTTEQLISEEDVDSGIGLVGIANKRSKMLEKKSIFTIAYDEMATQNVLRPDTGFNQQDLELS